jgi:hypothetical protein
MKKIKILLMASALGVGTLFALNAGEGDACGCIEDCDTFCDSSPIKNCTIVYTSGHELLCPYKSKPPIIT